MQDSYVSKENFIASFPTIVFKFKSIENQEDSIYLFEPRNYFTQIFIQEEEENKKTDDQLGIYMV